MRALCLILAWLSWASQCVAGMGAGGFGYQPPAPVERLYVRGQQLVDHAGASVALRGFNEGSIANVQVYAPGDAATLKAAGFNVLRYTPQWYYDPQGDCNTPYPVSNDAYDPPAPAGTGTDASGYFTQGQLSILDGQVAAADAVGLWSVVGITTNKCDFYTNPDIQARYQAMWKFLAKRYAGRKIALYELATEPNPTQPTGHQFDNAMVATMYEGAINAIRTVDTVTPIMVGSAKNYNVRTLLGSPGLPGIFLPDQSGIVYAANWYEWAGSVAGVVVGYTAQAKVNFTTLRGYPDYYGDTRGDQPTVSCTYPGIGATSYLMNATTLTTMYDNCAGLFSSTYNAPVLIEQIGVRTVTPGAWQYTSDMLDMFNARRGTGNVGWIWWQIRQKNGSGLADGAPGNGGNTGDLCIFCQAGNDNHWIVKDSTYHCTPYTWPGGGTSTCDDWWDMLKTKATN